MLPLTISLRSRRGATEIPSVADLAAYVVPNSGPSPDYTYTDGSRIGSPQRLAHLPSFETDLSSAAACQATPIHTKLRSSVYC